MSEVSEQLARQHAQTLRAQQSEATPEQICAERIAEQQLRIKQVMKQRTSPSLLLLRKYMLTHVHTSHENCGAIDCMHGIQRTWH